MAARNPPRYVPTLTEVVKSSPATSPAAAAVDNAEEQLVLRVMQRVDLALERRLREAIAAAVLEQTRSMAPVLRSEIEAAVRQTVAQAFAEESASRRR
jgi:hypothetical protein